MASWWNTPQNVADNLYSVAEKAAADEYQKNLVKKGQNVALDPETLKKELESNAYLQNLRKWFGVSAPKTPETPPMGEKTITAGNTGALILGGLILYLFLR